MKQGKKQQRAARVAAREAAWIRNYEAVEAKAHGDPNYKLPGGKERDRG